jgi:hypothetical protein
MAGLLPLILPALDMVRAVGGVIGLRPFTTKVLVRTWTGARVGQGTKNDVTTTLYNQFIDGSHQPLLVKQLTDKEIIASGGLYRDRDLRVGPITPSYAASLGLLAGGFGDSTIGPQPTTSPTEIFWNVSGPGMAPGGAWCDKIGETVTALHYEVVLRADGRQP